MTSLILILAGLVVTCPAWGIALLNLGEPVLPAAIAAGTVGIFPFLVAACVPGVIRDMMAEGEH